VAVAEHSAATEPYQVLPAGMVMRVVAVATVREAPIILVGAGVTG